MEIETNLKNYTFSLPKDIMEKLKDNIKKENFPSINFAVREALKIFLEKIEKENLKKEMDKASKDALFISDLKKNMDFFENFDSESYISEKREDEW
jgi:Arc/MetJ-type ribon-helix-helix transcriptional regulator